MSRDLGRLVAELKRRKVFRVAVVYGVVAFVIAQAADIAFPALQLPPWTVTLVVALAILGFPVALVLAWAFEITPEGVARTATARPGAAGGSPETVPWNGQRIAAVGGVVVLAAAAGAFVLFGGSLQRAPAPPVEIEASIAVLPFDDLSPDQDHGWFSAGITEDIQTHLARIGDVKVSGRTSVIRYADAGLSAREIGEALGVATILEGSVRRSDDRVRITAKLVHAATDGQLWAETFDRELSDIFQIQGEIAQEIAAALQTRFSPEQRAQLEAAPTGNLRAYDHFLRAREHALRLTRHDLDSAVVLYRQALELDPGYAQAHAGLSFAFLALEGYHGAGVHWLDSAEVAARRTIELDPAGADGYAALAGHQWNTGRLAEAIETYGRALSIRPNDPHTLWGLAFAQWLRGRLDEALRLSKRAVELDPATPPFTVKLGRSYAALGDLEAAERWYHRTLELQPDFPWGHQDLLTLYLAMGDRERAAERLRETEALLPGSPEAMYGAARLALLDLDYRTARARYDRLLEEHPGWHVPPFAEIGFVYLQLGAEAQAQEMWRRGMLHAEAALRRGSDNDAWMQWTLARISALTGDHQEALRWLQDAYDGGWRGQPMLDIAGDPLLETLQDDPGFEAIRVRILDEVAEMRARVRREGW